LDPDLENTNGTLWAYENSGETRGEFLILSHFSPSENPKGKWLTFEIFLKISLAENFVMPPVMGGQL